MTGADDKHTLLQMEIVRAKYWYTSHQKHVDKLMSAKREDARRYPPSGSDCRHPELWRAAHWLWFRQEGYLNEV